MKRFVAAFSGLAALVCVVSISTPAMAISEYNKQWKAAFLSGDDLDEGFAEAAKGAGCNVCHVKGHEDKKKARNEYGKAILEFLDKDDFPRDYVKENPEEAKKKILEGFRKAGEKKSSDGETFTAKIKAGKLPATDAGL